MNRVTLITATTLIALASTAVIATAKGGPGFGPRGGGIERMFEEFDTNQDGAITKAEIAAAAEARFAAADTNGDGLLSAEEMKTAAEARDSERRNKRIEARIDRMDTDGDGQISLTEMSARTDRLDRMFARLDADQDGSITQAELENAKGRRHGDRSKSE